jgi:hypothetical protein
MTPSCNPEATVATRHRAGRALPADGSIGVSRATHSSPRSQSLVPDRAASATPTPEPPHVGSHSRYSAGCRCSGCTAAHAAYLADWRAGRIRRSADTAPVRAHLQRLVGSGLVLGYLADEAGIPRRTVYAIWHSSRRTSPHTAAALLALRPLGVADALPTLIRRRDAIAASGGGPARRRAVLHDVDLDKHSAREVAEQLGVSPRTVQRWRTAQAATTPGSSA